ncbi:MAG TPA: TonB-dependent receptor [Bryobacteraceae bacterium]|nr:TonB-dependent receptor [Bryobacteraceae bacterium]
MRWTCVLLALAWQSVYGQVLYGSMVGNVTDASGAAVPNATVEVTQMETQLTRKAVTDAGGQYTLSTLSPGSYNVKVTAAGFKTFDKTNVPVTLNNVSRVDASLQVGEVNQTVEVTSAAPMLQTDRADVRHDITAETIQNVPLPPGNNFESLFKTVPGINPPTTAHSIPTNPSRALQFNVNGTSEYGNDIRIDGVSQFNIWVPENAAYIPSSDAIQVVNAVTGNFTPEQGLAGGSTVNVQIKSGTNTFHGDVYEYHFDNNTEAHNFFDPNNGITRIPKDIFNQFGGSVGGPIKKDKLFFFGNVEATRQRQFATHLATVPTLAMMQGDLRGSDPANGLAANSVIIYDPTTGNADGTGRSQIYATNVPSDTAHFNPLCKSAKCLNVIPTSRISPVAQKLMSLLQKAPGRLQASSSSSAPSDNYLAATDFSFNRITTDEKIDWNATNKFTMFGHFGYLHYDDLDPQMFGGVGGPPISDYGGNEGKGTGHTTTYSITGTYVASPTFVLDGNFGVTRMVTDSRQLDLDKKEGLDVLGIPGTNGTRTFEGSWPRFGISSFTDLGTHNNYMPYLRNDPQFYWSANATKIHGSHTVRFGGSFFILHLNHQQPEWNAGGSAEPGAGGFDFGSGPTACKDCNGGKASKTNAYNNFGSFLLGLDTAYGKNILVPDYFHTITHQYGAYVGDQWQVTPKFTLNLGLRWEYYPMPTRGGSRGMERYDFAHNMMLLCGVGNIPTDCGVSISKAMFVPRVGFAYRATPSFVIRAGYGITNEPYNLADDLRTNYPVLIPLYVPADAYQAAGVLDATSLQNAPVGSHLPIGIPIPALPDTSSGEVPALPNVALTTVGSKLERGYIQSWNFTLEKELGHDWVAQAGYVATRTIRQLGFQDLNVESPIAPAGCTPGSSTHECGGNASRPFYNAFYGNRTSTTSIVTPIANNHYDSLQTKLGHRFQSGYQVQLAYTWSKTIGIAGVSNEKNSAYIQTPAFYGLNRGLAPQDREQNFQAIFIAELPFGAGKRWANSGFASHLLGGWQVSGLMSIVSGSVFEIHSGGTSSNNLNASGNDQRPDLVKTSIPVSNVVGPGSTWFDTSAFGIVNDLNRFGTSPFYPLHGPGLFDLDLGLSRTFSISERVKLQFRAQAINSTNTAHFANPQGDFNNSAFGQVNSLANTGRDGGVDARQFEFHARLSF